MRSAIDHQFLQLAFERGILSPEQVVPVLREEEAREAAGGDPRPIGRALIERGAITSSTYSRTLYLLAERQSAELRRDTSSGRTDTLDAGPAGDEGVRGAETVRSRHVLRRFGKYEVERELGRGAMGVVYLAWRPDLRAHFAVKVLLHGEHASPAAVQRFRVEAQAAARLHHPGIVVVHDIGEVEGLTYVAMEYVEGTSLEEILVDPVRHGLVPARGARRSGSAPGGVDAVTAVRWTAEIADALQVAHEAGVIHRDLKPANVVLAKDGRIKVMDFGLAKLLEGGDAGTTRSGTILGSPAYMSPEMARGELQEVDARSDVYQIGAVLYELLTGRTPYVGENAMEVVQSVAEEEPPPPRHLHPGVDRDGETICLMAMAREKTARYPSARLMAEDCRRFLAGEALRARREGALARGVRWLRRRKLAAAVALAIVLALAVAGASAAARARAERVAAQERAARDRLEQERLERLRTIAGLSVKAALAVRRAGQPGAWVEQEFLPPLADAARATRESAPALAEPHFHLGRMARALLRFEEARREQDEALRKEPDYAPARYERAVLVAREYAVRLAELREAWLQAEGARLRAAGLLGGGGLGARAAPEPPTEAALAAGDGRAGELRRLLAEDLDFLDRAPAGADPSRPALSAAQADCARGLAACESAGHDGRARAQALLERALAADPHLEEAYEALARVAQARGDLPAAIEVLGRGLEADRGYVPHWLARGRLWIAAGLVEQVREKGDGAPFQRAEADFARAAELLPGAVEPWKGCGDAAVGRALDEVYRGANGAEHFRRAEAAFLRALDVDPAHVAAWVNLAKVRMNAAQALAREGVPPGEGFVRAREALDRALALDARRAEAWLVRGMVGQNEGVHRNSIGEDPTTAWRAAEADLTRALECDPSSARAWAFRGHVRTNLGNVPMRASGDAAPLYTLAEADFTEAIRLDPTLITARTGRVAVRTGLGMDAAAKGKDPTAWFGAAEEDARAAQEMNPDSAEGWVRRGILCSAWGNAIAEAGGDPTTQYTQALEHFGRALEREPRSVQARLARAQTALRTARHRLDRGADPREALDRSEADCTEILKASPDRVEAWVCRGMVREDRAGWLARQGLDPGADLRAADDDYTEALRRRPGDPDTLLSRGIVRVNLERWAEAIEDLEAAVKADPNVADRAQAPLERARQAARGK